MPTTDAYRYTLRVVALGDESRFTIHGVFTDYVRAKATADQWQAVLDRRYGPRRVYVVVHTLYPATARRRDQQWPVVE